MYIRGVGSAYPSNYISTAFIKSILGDFTLHQLSLMSRLAPSSGICSVLPQSYIEDRDTDFSILDALRVSLVSPTDLGYLAAEQALRCAGITIDEVGLIVGASSTPCQTCPSESQRVAARFGAKIPSYDIVGGLAAVPLVLEIVSSWKIDRCPNNILCVFTDTPTPHVRYGAASIEPLIFGDGASAMVISSRLPGRLKVIESSLKKSLRPKPLISVDASIKLRDGELESSADVRRTITSSLARLTECFSLDRKRTVFVGPELMFTDSKESALQFGLSEERIFSSTALRGYALGSTPLCALADAWPTLEEGDSVALMHTGDGIWSSSLLCVCGNTDLHGAQ